MLAHIWVAQPTDGDDGRALRAALELAACSGAHVTVCLLLDAGDDEPIDPREQLAREIAGDSAVARSRADARALALSCAPDVRLTSCVARVGVPVDVLDLVRTARPDLAVVTAPRRRGMRWVRRLLMPDATDVLVDAAPCPVLVIRPAQDRTGAIGATGHPAADDA